MCTHHPQTKIQPGKSKSPLQLLQLQPETHLTVSTSSPPRSKASRTHAAMSTAPTSKTAATTTSNPTPLRSPILSTNPTARLKEVRYPNRRIRSIVVCFPFLFVPSNASDGSNVPRQHPFRVVYFIQRPSGQWQ